MKHLAKFMTGALALGLWACSSQEPMPGGGTEATEGDVFANLTLSLPSSTRSTTVDPGENPGASNNEFEFGKNYENNVDEVLIILANNTAPEGEAPVYQYITSSLSNSIHDKSKAKPTYTVSFESSALNEFAEKEVYVFAYCNPTATLVRQVQGTKTPEDEVVGGLSKGDSFTDLTGTVQTDNANNPEIAQEKHFLMTNGLSHKKKLPTADEMLKLYNTKETAFDLGTVKVERVACRFDFQQTTIEGQTEANVYPIDDMVSGDEIALIKIEAMSLFNEAANFYYLPRVSANGLLKGATVCGAENTNNWIVSPFATEKAAFIPTLNPNSSLSGELEANYLLPLSQKPEEMDYTTISRLSQNEADNDGWNGSENTSYKIWRYATENTQPAIEMIKDNPAAGYKQVNLLTTGVMFRGEILRSSSNSTAAKTIAAAIKNGEILYAYSEEGKDDIKASKVTTMLGSALDVWKYAKTHNISMIRNSFINAVKDGYFKLYSDENATQIINAPEGWTEDAIFSDDVKAVKGATNNSVENNYNFVVYAPTVKEGKYHYYLYYPYYNRHNDNENPAIMGTMEFATVRNNIYKLAVTNVVQFGLPGDVPTTPDDDENPEVYFKVSVQVLDWVVRVNNIIL